MCVDPVIQDSFIDDLQPKHANTCAIMYENNTDFGHIVIPSNISQPSDNILPSQTSGSAMAEGPRDTLVSRNSATTKYRYRVALFA